jgi:Raf kinase inhibitor-like YbhB/YbcL family protein
MLPTSAQAFADTPCRRARADWTMRITSPKFDDGGPIPRRYTCDGSDVSPPLTIEDVPEATASLVLIVDDPHAHHGSFVHWLVWNIPPSTRAVPASIPGTTEPVELGGATQGMNDFRRVGYNGPCPPTGTHTYRFLLHALSATIDLPAGSRRADLERAMAPVTAARAELRGTYAREDS